MEKKLVNIQNCFKAVIMFALILITAPVGAQEENATSKKLWGGFGYFAFSEEQINIDNLNASLSANDYNQLNTLTSSYGGGGAFVIHNLVIGGNGAWLFGSGAMKSGNETNLSGGYGFFNMGYVVYENKHNVLYPTLGIGGGGYDLSFSKAGSSIDFNQQLTTPSGMITAKAGGFITNIQISYQHFFNKNAMQGFYIGFKAGYKYSPGTWNISINDQQLSNSPKVNMNGFFLTLYLGGGSLTKN